MAAITDEDFQRMLTAFAVRGYEVVKKGQVRKTVLDAGRSGAFTSR